MDDLKIAELFVRNRDPHQPPQPLTLAAAVRHTPWPFDSGN